MGLSFYQPLRVESVLANTPTNISRKKTLLFCVYVVFSLGLKLSLFYLVQLLLNLLSCSKHFYSSPQTRLVAITNDIVWCLHNLKNKKTLFDKNIDLTKKKSSYYLFIFTNFLLVTSLKAASVKSFWGTSLCFGRTLDKPIKICFNTCGGTISSAIQNGYIDILNCMI